jgi:hypothetical protein
MDYLTFLEIENLKKIIEDLHLRLSNLEGKKEEEIKRSI